MQGLGFARPPAGASEDPTPHLYIANSHGISTHSIALAFSRFGPIAAISDPSNSHIIISFHHSHHAQAARQALNRKPCPELHNHQLLIDFAVPRPDNKSHLPEQPPVFQTSEELNIPGLTLIPDFISPEEELRLLHEVDSRPWQALAKRRVQHYGYEFLYKLRNVDISSPLGDLPGFLEPVLEKLHSLPELQSSPEMTFPFDQLTVNEYPAGVGLSPHVDTHSAFQGSIISLSLAGACVMEFRRYSSSRLVNRKVLLLPRRSLLLLSGESRYAWHHYIPHRKIDTVDEHPVHREARRVSFTLRKVRDGPCSCSFRQFCDSQADDHRVEDNEPADDEAYEAEENSFPEADNRGIVPDQFQVPKPAFANQNPSSTRGGEELPGAIAAETSPDPATDKNNDGVEQTSPDEDAAALMTPEIEKRFVHKVYDAIAPHFSSTRFAKWPRVAEFLNSLHPGSLVLDSGCGNGKYLGFNPTCFFIGCDISPSLISICSRRGHQVFVGDAVNLPFRAGSFDSAISIAVLHHLSNDQRRRRAIMELLRVVKKGGRVLITVWAAEQEDKSLVNKWTPLEGRCVEEWVGDTHPRNNSENSSSKMASPLERIDETGEEQQEYFVPWHLPYHRAEIAASQQAVASGFARKDDKKSAVVYNRYYHVFVRGELERLVSSIPGAEMIEAFFDKSNWCVVLRSL